MCKCFCKHDEPEHVEVHTRGIEYASLLEYASKNKQLLQYTTMAEAYRALRVLETKPPNAFVFYVHTTLFVELIHDVAAHLDGKFAPGGGWIICLVVEPGIVELEQIPGWMTKDMEQHTFGDNVFSDFASFIEFTKNPLLHNVVGVSNTKFPAKLSFLYIKTQTSLVHVPVYCACFSLASCVLVFGVQKCNHNDVSLRSRKTLAWEVTIDEFMSHWEHTLLPQPEASPHVPPPAQYVPGTTSPPPDRAIIEAHHKYIMTLISDEIN